MTRTWARAVALGLALLAGTGASTASLAAQARRFSFALLAETPRAAQDESRFADLLRDIDASSVSFAVHAGDFKGAAEPCSDELYESRKALFVAARKPLVLVAGGNDWCADGRAAGFDATERLGRLRELFQGSNESFGEPPLRLTRQSEMARFRGFPENMRWEFGNILFVALNVPGDNNHFRLGAGRNGEFEDRLIANRIWLERAFHIAARDHAAGIVVVIQADPHFELALRRPDRRARERDGYYEFKTQLRDLSARFSGQVLLMHGGDKGARYDQPLQDANGKPLRNLSRVQAPPAQTGETGAWVRIVVNAGVNVRAARLFQVKVERVARSE